MDIEYFLKSRTGFIRYFYENAVRPFNEIKSAIEDEKEPYIPPYSEDGEPPFLEEWMDAEQGVEILGHACISMLSSSLQLYLKAWVNRLEKEHGMKFIADFKKRGWFNGYKQIFNELKLPLSQCGVDLDVVEQVALARNRVQHPEELTKDSGRSLGKRFEEIPEAVFCQRNRTKDGNSRCRWQCDMVVKAVREVNKRQNIRCD